MGNGTGRQEMAVKIRVNLNSTRIVRQIDICLIQLKRCIKSSSSMGDPHYDFISPWSPFSWLSFLNTDSRILWSAVLNHCPAEELHDFPLSK